MERIAPAQQASRYNDNNRYWEGGAYFQCWYPLCRSQDLAPGQIKGVDWLDTKVIVYRDAQGKAVVQSAFCPHLGADLSLASIVEGKVRCIYHHWEFDTAGACTRIPGMDKPPRAARLANYPVAEAWGLIWCFNGENAFGDVPYFPGVDSEDDVAILVKERPVQPCEVWIQASNSVDFQHLLAVHHFPKEVMPADFEVGPNSIRFASPTMRPEGYAIVHGANTFTFRSLFPLPYEHFAIYASNAPGPGLTQAFYAVGVRREAGVEESEIQRRLEELSALSANLYQEDEEVLGTIRMRRRGNAKLVRSDAYLGRYLDYIEALPRAVPLDA